MNNSSKIAHLVILMLILSGWPLGSHTSSSGAADKTPPVVSVSRPRSGDVIPAGTVFAIIWSSRDNVGVTSHDVFFSSDGGANYTAIATDLPGTAQTTDWTAPNISTTLAKIRVVARDAAGNRGAGVSTGFFTVTADATAPSVMVTSPNGGETLEAGGTVTITWTALDNHTIASQDVLYSSNGGVDFQEIVRGLNGDVRSVTWRVPCQTTTTGRIRIVARDPSGHEGHDTSDDDFRVRSLDSVLPSATVTYPNGGEVLMAGGNHILTWDARDNQCVSGQDLYFSSDGGATYHLIAGNIPGNERTHEWIAPSVATSGAKVKLVVRDAAGNQAEDTSDSTFEIRIGPPDTMPPNATLIQPNGGETLSAGTTALITWTASDNVGISNQDLFFSSDGGLTFEPIVTGLPGGRQSYYWTVPASSTTTGRIKVTVRDASGNESSDMSDGHFTIAVLPGDPIPPTVDILSPDGGESILAGRRYRISWTSQDNDGVAAHHVSYSTDGGNTYTPLAANLSGIRRSYDWQVPLAAASETVKIKVTARDPSGNEGIGVSRNICSVVTLSQLDARLGIDMGDVDQAPAPPDIPGVQPGGQATVTEDDPIIIEALDDVDLPTQSHDMDQDGLPDSFETVLARAFDPYYIPSVGEPNNFCFLENDPDALRCRPGGFVSFLTPLVHYRVHFISVVYDCNNQPIARQYIIDYLPIWDHDAGFCGLGGLGSHDFDIERTAALVVTTVTDRHSLNVYDYFLVAFFSGFDEGAFCLDNSRIYVPRTLLAAGSHLGIIWAQGSHQNILYTGENPHGSLLCQCFYDSLICIPFPPFCVICGLFQICFYPGYDGHRALNEHFVNVGELTRPIPGNSWINVDKIKNKLRNPVIKLRNCH